MQLYAGCDQNLIEINIFSKPLFFMSGCFRSCQDPDIAISIFQKLDRKTIFSFPIIVPKILAFGAQIKY